MKTPELPLYIRAPKNRLMVFGLFAAMIYAAYMAGEAILSDDLTSLVYVAILALGGVIVVTVLNNWRRGLYFLVAWILFEDFVRKYLGNNMAIYFAKDVLAILLYLSFFRSQIATRTERFRVPFRISLFLFIWLGMLQVFNPASSSIFYGILGMKVYFLYVPLIFIGYGLFESEEDLRRFFSFTCILILIVTGLGIAQSIIGPSFLNPVHLQEDIRELSTTFRDAPISGLRAYRPTSVFVSAGRFQDFLLVAWMISLGYGSYLFLRSRQGRTIAFSTVGVVAAGSIMCASRGVFMWNGGIALMVIAGFLWGAPWRQGEAIRVLRAIQRATLFGGIAVIVLLTLFPEAIGSRLAIYSETLMPNSPASELVARTRTYPMEQLGYAFDYPRWPYGYGIGTCTLGIQYVARILHATPMNIGVESGYGNLILELGVLGLILWIVLGFSISISAWKVVQELRGTPWFPLAFVIFLFSALLYFPMTYTSFSMFQDFVVSVYFWLLVGILFRLRIFSRATQTNSRQV